MQLFLPAYSADDEGESWADMIKSLFSSAGDGVGKGAEKTEEGVSTGLDHAEKGIAKGAEETEKGLNKAAEAVIIAPSPKRDNVIAVKSPKTTPATRGTTDFRPCATA